MADDTAFIELHPKVLTTSDAAGLLADVYAPPMFQPTHVLATDFSNPYTLSSSGITTAGDVLRFLFSPLNDIDNVVWVPMATRAVMTCAATVAAFTDLFELDACYAINKPGIYRGWPWDSATLDAARETWDDTTVRWIQTLNPNWSAWPPTPSVADGGSLTLRALAGFTYTVKTFDATAKANSEAFFDVRFLGYPRGSDRNAGFYTPRMFFNPN